MTKFEYLPWFESQLTEMVTRYDHKTFPQSLLLIGEPDIGKSIFANDVAKSILCLDRKGHHACGQCQSCLWIDKNSHPDFLSIASEDKSHFIKVDQIRQLIQFAQMTSETGRKVIIIHNADEMNLNAANALLKTLEEPMQNCYLILVTNYPKKLPVTITSRCQRQLLSISGEHDVIFNWLKQVNPVSEDKIHQVLGLSYGRPILSYQFLLNDILLIMNELESLLVRYWQHRSNLSELTDFMVKNWHFASHLVLYWLSCALKEECQSDNIVKILRECPLMLAFEQYETFIKIIELSSTPVKQEWLLQEWLLRL
ncbi:DNA polymerase III subunit [Wohlfahrtiimonas larvae]|uniref:DNA-directed DNA polymerase n=1 Tax=Wohlfahrtiimonas larvae TaxID=1157986 RepID=A0ABP9MEA2_9GAMM|nr:DNA polymerase III subunit [Wohlfahrtiimonas larvae]